MTYQQLRYQQYCYHETCPYSKDWNWKSVYTNLKAHYYMEGASLLVYLLQNTSIHPNYITILYALFGVTGGLLIATGVPLYIWLGILLIFNRGILDLTDGHLARLMRKESALGAKLDLWAGRIGTYAFYLGVAMYTYNINPYVLVYFIPLMFFKSKGRACIIDLVCFLVLLSLTLH